MPPPDLSKARFYAVALALLAGAVVYLAFTHSTLREPPLPDSLSKPVANLAGSLSVAQAQITTEEYFQIRLNLYNCGKEPLAVQVGDPFSFRITVLDAAGKTVEPAFSRSDLLCSPQWGVIPGRSYLGLPVSQKSEDGAKVSHLDIVTFIWKLSPGKYRIVGRFSSDTTSSSMGPPGKAKVWQGELELPPLDVTVVEKE